MKYKNIDEYRNIYEEWKESNLSVRFFCITMGLNESHFYYWKRKLETLVPPASSSFIPVQIKSFADGTIALFGTLWTKGDTLRSQSRRMKRID